MTIKKKFELCPGLAIWCEGKECETLREELHKRGWTWVSGTSLKEIVYHSSKCRFFLESDKRVSYVIQKNWRAIKSYEYVDFSQVIFPEIEVTE